MSCSSHTRRTVNAQLCTQDFKKENRRVTACNSKRERERRELHVKLTVAAALPRASRIATKNSNSQVQIFNKTVFPLTLENVILRVC